MQVPWGPGILKCPSVCPVRLLESCLLSAWANGSPAEAVNYCSRKTGRFQNTDRPLSAVDLHIKKPPLPQLVT